MERLGVRHALLRGSGHRGRGARMVVCDCNWAAPRAARQLGSALSAGYRAAGMPGVPPRPPDEIAPWQFPPEPGAYFDQVVARRYPFQRRYTAEDFISAL